MKKRLYILLSIALTGLCLVPAQAQPIKYAQAGMPFLQISVGGRSAALGSTYGTIIGESTAMFANPAGLAMVKGFDAFSSVTNWIADIKHYGLAGAYNVEGIGTFGVGVVWMDYGEFRSTLPATASDSPTDQERGYVDGGTFNVNEYAIGLSYARQITGQFYVGGNIKYATQELPDVEIEDELQGRQVAENKINLIVLDFGTLYYPGISDLRFGVSIRNFANQADYYDQRFELPLTFDFSVAMNVLDPFLEASSNSKLTLAVDWLHPRDYSERLHLGLEYGFMDTLFLRGGYKFNYDEESLTAGVGTHLGLGNFGIKANYAYTAFGDFFGQVHRIDLGINLNP